MLKSIESNVHWQCEKKRLNDLRDLIDKVSILQMGQYASLVQLRHRVRQVKVHASTVGLEILNVCDA